MTRAVQVVMFDIDGTLADTAGFDGELYAHAVRTVLDVEVDRTWASYEHATDSGILAQILRDSRFGDAAADLGRRVESRFVELVHAYCSDRASPIREIAGAKQLVLRLLAEPSVRVAVATGGWRATAELKLRCIGLDPARLPSATASDAFERTAIMRLAAQRALRGVRAAKSTYFGDGPWDKRASAELNYDFVAVGGVVPHAVRFDDLADCAAICERLGL